MCRDSDVLVVPNRAAKWDQKGCLQDHRNSVHWYLRGFKHVWSRSPLTNIFSTGGGSTTNQLTLNHQTLPDFGTVWAFPKPLGLRGLWSRRTWSSSLEVGGTPIAHPHPKFWSCFRNESTFDLLVFWFCFRHSIWVGNYVTLWLEMMTG